MIKSYSWHAPVLVSIYITTEKQEYHSDHNFLFHFILDLQIVVTQCFIQFIHDVSLYNFYMMQNLGNLGYNHTNDIDYTTL